MLKSAVYVCVCMLIAYMCVCIAYVCSVLYIMCKYPDGEYGHLYVRACKAGGAPVNVLQSALPTNRRAKPYAISQHNLPCFCVWREQAGRQEKLSGAVAD